MTQHLIGLGHKSVALISSSSSDQDSIWQERVGGFKQAIAEAGLTEKAPLILDAYDLNEEGVQQYRPELIKQCFTSANRPTAAFVLSDLLAVRVMETFREMGLDVPREVAVAGFDNTLIAEHALPPLTTVKHPTETMARRAAEILFEQIEAKAGEKKAAAYVRLPCELIIRKSCGAYLSSPSSPPGIPT
jgi:LacI family transcriptional regulator